MKVNSWRKQLESKRRGGAKEYPVGTLLFYGPHDRRASKVVAAVFHGPEGDDSVLERWASVTMDVRMDPRIGREVTRFFDRHKVRRVVSTPGLAGCPHEEGIDYPDGEACPRCPFWADRDRWEMAAKPAMPPGTMSNCSPSDTRAGRAHARGGPAPARPPAQSALARHARCRSCLPSANSSTILRLKAGMSSGLRLVTRP